MLRISKGKFKGRKLLVSEDSDIRPFTSRVQQILFDLLREQIVDSLVIDLYAGSGIMGVTGLSLGAKRAIFIESGREEVKFLKKNFTELGITNITQIMKEDVNRVLSSNSVNKLELNKKAGEKLRIIIVDPPFTELEKFSLNKIIKLVDEDTILVVKLPQDHKLAEKEQRNLKYQQKIGNNQLVFYYID